MIFFIFSEKFDSDFSTFKADIKQVERWIQENEQKLHVSALLVDMKAFENLSDQSTGNLL